MKKLNGILLFLIIVLGGFLRLYGLSSSPPSLNWDEAALGYNAYSVSETLRDEYGKVLPIFTRSFDEYKSALPLYMMMPFIKIFGLNEIAVRLPSALLGTFSILIVFLLAKEMFKSRLIALSSAFVFAIEPWAVHFARTSQEANTALFFLLLGVLLFLYSKKHHSLLPVAMASFMVSMYTYNANKIIVPILLLLALLGAREPLHYPRRVIKLSLAVVVFFAVPFIVLALKGEAFARVTSTNIFVLWRDAPLGLSAEHKLPPAINFFVHNDIFYFVWDVVARYFSYFSPHNLFLRESAEPVTVIAENSMFHPFEFVFWVVGLAFLIKNFKRHKELLLVMLVSPIPAMMTWNWFQPLRAMSLFWVFSILVGVGVGKSVEHIKPFGAKLFLIFSIVAMGVGSAAFLFDSIMVHLPLRDSGNWQPGFRETVPTVYELSEDYEQVIVDSPHAQPYIFYLFYSAYPPSRYLKEIDPEKINPPRKFYDFGKFKFRKIYWPEDRNIKNTLFVGDEFSLPQHDIETQPNAKVLQEFEGDDGNIFAKFVSTEE